MDFTVLISNSTKLHSILLWWLMCNCTGVIVLEMLLHCLIFDLTSTSSSLRWWRQFFWRMRGLWRQIENISVRYLNDDAIQIKFFLHQQQKWRCLGLRQAMNLQLNISNLTPNCFTFSYCVDLRWKFWMSIRFAKVQMHL